MTGALRTGLMLGSIAFGAMMLVVPPGAAAPREEVRAAYETFVGAQNARDIAGVRALLLDSPQFLWVSNGQSFWGRETMIARMMEFQRAEVWRAKPDLERATFVEVSPLVAYLHMPLTLAVGSAARGVAETNFLVSALFVRTGEGWRISALFTTIRATE